MWSLVGTAWSLEPHATVASAQQVMLAVDCGHMLALQPAWCYQLPIACACWSTLSALEVPVSKVGANIEHDSQQAMK